jgi:hypothetical protein
MRPHPEAATIGPMPSGFMNAGSGIDPVIAAKNWRHV